MRCESTPDPILGLDSTQNRSRRDTAGWLHRQMVHQNSVIHKISPWIYVSVVGILIYGLVTGLIGSKTYRHLARLLNISLHLSSCSATPLWTVFVFITQIRHINSRRRSNKHLWPLNLWVRTSLCLYRPLLPGNFELWSLGISSSVRWKPMLSLEKHILNTCTFSLHFKSQRAADGPMGMRYPHHFHL